MKKNTRIETGTQTVGTAALAQVAGGGQGIAGGFGRTDDGVIVGGGGLGVQGIIGGTGFGLTLDQGVAVGWG